MQEHNRKRAIVFGAAAAVWTGVMFFFSGQSGEDSGALSEGLTGVLFGWLIRRGVSAERVEFFVRKGAHMGGFALMGFLLGMSMLSALKRRAAAAVTVCACAAAAVLNELHQMLAEGRHCSVADMGIDFAGAALGLLAAVVVLHAFSSKKYYDR